MKVQILAEPITVIMKPLVQSDESALVKTSAKKGRGERGIGLVVLFYPHQSLWLDWAKT